MGRGDREPVYLIDVRTEEEYRLGHVPGFSWFPGGQAVQRTDDVVGVRDGAIVFCCDDIVRATATASWYRQMGLPNVHVLDGGTTAWSAAGLALEEGMPEEAAFGLTAARERVRLIAPAGLRDRLEGRHGQACRHLRGAESRLRLGARAGGTLAAAGLD